MLLQRFSAVPIATQSGQCFPCDELMLSDLALSVVLKE